jgi:hypothetical protein
MDFPFHGLQNLKDAAISRGRIAKVSGKGWYIIVH